MGLRAGMRANTGSDGSPEPPAAAGADGGTGSGATDGEGCGGSDGAAMTRVARAACCKKAGAGSELDDAAGRCCKAVFCGAGRGRDGGGFSEPPNNALAAGRRRSRAQTLVAR